MFKARILSEAGWTDYSDPALFEVDAKARLKATRTRHEARAIYRGEVVGENHALVRASRGPWRAPARRAWQEPAGVEIGAQVTVIARDGTEFAAEVWSLAPEGGVWLATDAGGYLWAHAKRGDVYVGLRTPGGHVGRLRPGA